MTIWLRQPRYDELGELACGIWCGNAEHYDPKCTCSMAPQQITCADPS